jgi:hypothetical protein
MPTPLHRRGDYAPVNWPPEAPCLYQVRTWDDRYTATYHLERDATIAAAVQSTADRFDAKVVPVFLTR